MMRRKGTAPVPGGVASPAERTLPSPARLPAGARGRVLTFGKAHRRVAVCASRRYPAPISPTCGRTHRSVVPLTFKNRASIESSKRELTGCPSADTSVVRGGGHDMAQGRTRPSDTEVRTERDSPKHRAPPSRDPTVRRPRPTRLVRCIFHLRCQKRLFAHPRSSLTRPPVHPSRTGCAGRVSPRVESA